MKKVILHNSFDPVSRKYVEKYGEKVDDIIDWYVDGEVDRWLEMGGDMFVSAFPSLVIFKEEGFDIYRMPSATETRKLLK